MTRSLMVGTISAMFISVLLLTALAVEPPGTVMKNESFDRDPGWDGVRNRIKLPPVRKQQNFGYSRTNYSGAAQGEIGGVVWRSITPAYYGKKVGPFTWDDPLNASGTITCLKSNTKRGWQTGSTFWVGFFNHEAQGWRPINFMGFRLETHSDTKAKNIENRPGIELGYGTRKWTAGGAHVNTTGEEQERNVLELDQEAMRRVPPDGSKHKWEMHYDPKGNNGTGQLIFVFDGISSVCNIRREHREQGITFDRFGIFNNQLCGNFIEAYMDDVTVNGEKDDFSSDPNWDAKGNRDMVEDTREYGAQDYGYSANTNHAGGVKPGEMGGLFQSVDPWEKDFMGYYGDRAGPLTMDQKLVARGKFSSQDEFSIDSTFALGWFNAQDQGLPLKNFVGVYFDSLSDTGRIIQPFYGTKEGNKERGDDKVTFLPDGTHYDWTLEYDPASANGRGAIAFTMNGQTCTMALEEGAKQKGAIFDRFGVFNLGWANSKHCIVWLDDISYTAAAP